MSVKSEWRRLKRRRLIRKLIRRQGKICRYCGVELNRKVGHGRQLTIDHRVPRSRGGTDRIKNLVLACATCNRRKGSTTELEFLTSDGLIMRRIGIATENANT